jgi:hypothetical protein
VVPTVKVTAVKASPKREHEEVAQNKMFYFLVGDLKDPPFRQQLTLKKELNL